VPEKKKNWRIAGGRKNIIIFPTNKMALLKPKGCPGYTQLLCSCTCRQSCGDEGSLSLAVCLRRIITWGTRQICGLLRRNTTIFSPHPTAKETRKETTDYSYLFQKQKNTFTTYLF
jgi:hypothetical protein